MRISDYIEQSFSNLWKRKLRTFLTISGVVIGVGTLASMLAFGKGVQNNITRQFKDMDLFNIGIVLCHKGGKTRLDNAQLICKPCNSKQVLGSLMYKGK